MWTSGSSDRIIYAITEAEDAAMVASGGGLPPLVPQPAGDVARAEDVAMPLLPGPLAAARATQLSEPPLDVAVPLPEPLAIRSCSQWLATGRLPRAVSCVGGVLPLYLSPWAAVVCVCVCVCACVCVYACLARR